MTEPQKLWLAALRSGQYRQCTGRLRDEDGNYCCLGVCTRVAMNAGVTSEGLDDKMLGWAGLPESVREWVGLQGQMGVSVNGSQPSLTALNDNHRFTFPQIADHLETHYALYFETEGASACT
jgi:hypothetical protein